MSEYDSVIQQLLAVGMENSCLKHDAFFVVRNLNSSRKQGIAFIDALMEIPEKCDQFLKWIGMLNTDIPQEFIDLYMKDINWLLVSACVFGPINIAFLKKYADHLNWNAVCWGNALPEDVLREYEDCISWETLSYTKAPLSEQFMRDYADKLDWKGIFERKPMSKSFAKEMRYRI